jgi:hypothetical protein
LKNTSLTREAMNENRQAGVNSLIFGGTALSRRGVCSN